MNETSEIEIVSADQWKNLPLERLFEQRTLMYNRYEYLVSSKKEYASVILAGLHQLDELIAKSSQY